MALLHPNGNICLQASFLQLGHKHRPGTLCCHGIFFCRSSIAPEFLLSHRRCKAVYPLTSNLFPWNPDQAKRSPPGDSVSVTGWMGTLGVVSPSPHTQPV